MSWWQTVSAIGAAMLPFMGGIFAYALWFVRSTAREENAKNNAVQLAQIASMYTRSMASNITGSEIEHRLDELRLEQAKMRGEIAELHLYSHVRVHDLEGDIAAVRISAELFKAQLAISTKVSEGASPK